MSNEYDLFFEELEAQEDLAWWEYALAGGAGVALGIVAYVAIAT